MLTFYKMLLLNITWKHFNINCWELQHQFQYLNSTKKKKKKPPKTFILKGTITIKS